MSIDSFLYRTSLEITYGKGLEKLANKLAKMLTKIKVK